MTTEKVMTYKAGEKKKVNWFFFLAIAQGRDGTFSVK